MCRSNAGHHKALLTDDLKMKPVACLGKLADELPLSSAVAFSEWMNAIYFGEQMGHFVREHFARKRAEEVIFGELAKHCFKLCFYRIRRTEMSYPAASMIAFRQGSDPECSRPVVNIPEEVLVNSLEVPGIEISRNRVELEHYGAHAYGIRFATIKLLLIRDAEVVSQYP